LRKPRSKYISTRRFSTCGRLISVRSRKAGRGYVTGRIIVILPPSFTKLILKLSYYFIILLARYPYKYILINNLSFLIALADLGIYYKRLLRL
jgi:hypothetical protein